MNAILENIFLICLIIPETITPILAAHHESTGTPPEWVLLGFSFH